MNHYVRSLIGLILFGAFLAQAATPSTIHPTNKFAWGPNMGWMDWRGDTNYGAVIGAFVCSGSVWSANAGWMQLGNGAPSNGIRYQNNAATDCGVNHDGIGNLTGYAWAANLGWLTFTNRDVTGTSYSGPQVDLLTGRLTGFIWSANAGWISLSNQFAFVQTTTMDCGPDTDGDGIPDAWELQFAPNLAVLNGAGDNDGDGVSNLMEFEADTNPLNPLSHLMVTSTVKLSAMDPTQVTWSSTGTRQYRVRGSTNVALPAPWPDAGLGLFAPDPGGSTTRTVPGSPDPNRFFVIEAVKPLQ